MSRRNEGIPQLSAQEKLEQIRTGKSLQRRKSRADVKDTVVSGKDGSTIKKKEVAEKYEETTVRRKKKNYIMYESKLGTEKNTEITKIAAPKPKKEKVLPTPRPRIAEVIITRKKRREYLDNYKYHESKVLRKRNASVVEHKKLNDFIIWDKIETFHEKKTIGQGDKPNQYQSIQAYNASNRRIPKNRSDMTNIKQQDSSTATNFYNRPTAAPEDQKLKSQIVVKQIMSRRGAPSQNNTIGTNENNINTINVSENKPRTPIPPSTSRSNQRGNTPRPDQRATTPEFNQRNTSTSQRDTTTIQKSASTIEINQRNTSRINQRGNAPENNHRDNQRNKVEENSSVKTITTSASVRRRNNDNPGTKTVIKVETRVERKVNEPKTIEVNRGRTRQRRK